MTKKIYYINKTGRNIFLFWSYNRFKDAKIFVPIEFKKHYTEMPVNYEQSSNEKIFGDLNQDSNPLSSKEYQKWIKDNNISHTSMSVGDMIYDDKDDKWFVVLSLGFKDLSWISR